MCDAVIVSIARTSTVAFKVSVWLRDVFPFMENDSDATATARIITLGLGHASESQPQPHSPDYDFPEALLPVVIDQLCAITDRLSGPPSS